MLATNVAETSITVPGVRYVVDPGTARISRYNRRTKVQRLPIEPISQASADQRAGRCGRVGPGICIRLYSEEDYAARPRFTEPEILRTNLASVILQMAALGLGDVERFPFVDPPDTRAIRDGINLLVELGAMRPDRTLTPIGRKLARLPIDPRYGRMILEADAQGCLLEVLVITAALSIRTRERRPTRGRRRAARPLRHLNSDFLTLLNLWRHLEREQRQRPPAASAACAAEHLNHVRVREWQGLGQREVARACAATGAGRRRQHPPGAARRPAVTRRHVRPHAPRTSGPARPASPSPRVVLHRRDESWRPSWSRPTALGPAAPSSLVAEPLAGHLCAQLRRAVVGRRRARR